MDELTFQHELHQLKRQMADISMRYSQAAPPSLPRDPFLTQVNDLKGHLASLEQNLEHAQPELRKDYRWQGIPGSCTPFENIRLQMSPEAITLNQQDSGILPTPQMQHFYIGLKDNVQSLSHRISEIERSVSHLEDKVDSFDPQRFTPPGSDATGDDGEHIKHSDFDNVGVMPQWLSLPSASCDDSSPPISAEPVTHDSGRSEQSTHLRSLAFVNTLAMLRFYAAKIDGHRSYPGKGDPGLLQAVINLNSKLLDLTNVVDAPEAPTAASIAEDYNIPTYSPCAAAVDGVTHIPVEGVAFRDQEISRMDELLRNAQENLRASEENAAGTAEAMEQLQAQYNARVGELENKTAEASQRERNLRNTLKILSIREVQIGQLREVLREKDRLAREWRETYYRLKHDSDGRSACLQAAEIQISHLQELSNDRQDSGDEETDQAVPHQEEEVRKLQDFCEKKDVVINEQEQLIARGAKLLTERDEEIKEIERRRKVAEDDKEHELRHKIRLSKLLEERDAELSAIRLGIAESCAVPLRCPRDAHGGLNNPERQISFMKARLGRCAAITGVPEPADYELHERVSADGGLEFRAVLKNDSQKNFRLWSEPAKFGESELVSPRWSPEAIQGYQRLPHEAHRASVWEHGRRARALPEFGKPSSLSQRNHVDTSRDDGQRGRTPHLGEIETEPVPPSSDRKLQKSSTEDSSSLPQEERMPDGLMPGSGHNEYADKGHSPRHTRRPRRPLDHTFRPPLPAPIVARKVQSIADARSASRCAEPRQIPKHRSMQELQAYVETEAESDGGSPEADVLVPT